MARSPGLFTLIVLDRDKGVFSVEGPMADDTKWNDAVVAAIDAGRNVSCHTPGGPGRTDVEAAAASYSQTYDYKRVPAGSIVNIFGRPTHG